MTEDEQAQAVLEGLARVQRWRYQDPGGTYTFTEREILQLYYPWWQEQLRRVGRADLISPENCIQDFVVVNWAWRVND